MLYRIHVSSSPVDHNSSSVHYYPVMDLPITVLWLVGLLLLSLFHPLYTVYNLIK